TTMKLWGTMGNGHRMDYHEAKQLARRQINEHLKWVLELEWIYNACKNILIPKPSVVQMSSLANLHIICQREDEYYSFVGSDCYGNLNTFRRNYASWLYLFAKAVVFLIDKSWGTNVMVETAFVNDSYALNIQDRQSSLPQGESILVRQPKADDLYVT
ncbi:hypothetical protein HW555_000086, partial [Spodoptera exigua]